MLEFAVKFTADPDKLIEEDVQALHEAGFNEQEVIDIVMIVSLCNFNSRVSVGRGNPPSESGCT